MRLSHHFGSTLRDSPAQIDAVSHQLLVRAGFIRQLGQGLFSCLPLARRSLTKIENIMREEMNAIGGQEMTMPIVHPVEIWQATGRRLSIGSGRLLACIAEEHHDDKGLMWPVTVAPYGVHLVSLGQAEAADRVYGALRQAGVEVPFR